MEPLPSQPKALMLLAMSEPIDPLTAQLIVDQLATGSTITDACAVFDIPPSSLYRRMRKDGDYADAVNAARAVGFEIIAERLRKVARGEDGWSSGDWKRDKLIIDTDMRLLAKWAPAKYGDRPEPEQSKSLPVFTETSDPNEASRIYENLMKQSQ